MGSILQRGEFIPEYLSLYIEVEDLDKTISRIQKLGGELIRPPFKPDSKTELAIVSDPEGHVITLKKARTKTGLIKGAKKPNRSIGKSKPVPNPSSGP